MTERSSSSSSEPPTLSREMQKIRDDIFSADEYFVLPPSLDLYENDWIWDDLEKTQTIRSFTALIGVTFSEGQVRRLERLLKRSAKIQNLCVQLYFETPVEMSPDFACVLRGLLHNTSVKVLDIGAPLSDEAAVDLHDLLVFNETLTEICLGRHACLTGHHVNAISRSLEDNQALTKLSFSCAVLSTYDFAILLSTLRSKNTTLQTLDLVCCLRSSDRNAGVWAVKMIEESLAENVTLQSLNLEANRLGGTQLLGAVLRGLSRNSSIKTIVLANCLLSEVDAKHLALFLRGRSFPVKTLDLRGNHLGGSALKSVAAGLRVSPTTLHRLELVSTGLDAEDFAILMEAINDGNLGLRELMLGGNWSLRNGLTSHLARVIEELVANNESIQTLTLSGCYLRGAVTFGAILRGLSRNSSICVLDLNMNNLDDNDAVQIAEMLRKNTSVQKLILSSNKITSVGLSSIVTALEFHPLRELSIESNPIESIEDLAGFLRVDEALESLSLGYINLRDVGAEQLASSLMENSHLKELFVNNCGIDVGGVAAFANMLSHDNALKTLHMWGATWTAEGIRGLRDCLKWNTCLETIELSLFDDDDDPLLGLYKEIYFYCKMNRIGRKHFVGPTLSDRLWSRVIKKVDSEGGSESLFYTLCENPDMLARRNKRGRGGS